MQKQQEEKNLRREKSKEWKELNKENSTHRL